MQQENAKLCYLAVDQLSRGRYQPRQDFDQNALEELAQSIKEQGIIEPIVVRPSNNNRYEIVAGERRWRAAQIARLDTVPCIVRNYTDEEAAEVSIIENIQREDLNPIEEARAYQQLLDNFNYIHEEVASAVGKSRSKITNALRLLRLDDQVKKLLVEKKLTEGHGKILAGLPVNEQIEYANKCVEKNWSVRKVEQVVKQRQFQSAIQASQDVDAARLEKLASERLNSEVKLDNNIGTHSGWLKIKYYDYETLAGILKKMGIPQL